MVLVFFADGWGHLAKSLECFIQVLLDESCKTVREAGARKLTAGHLYVYSLPLLLHSSFFGQDANGKMGVGGWGGK